MMFEVHGSGVVMRHTPHAAPPASPAPLCTITGVIHRTDGSVITNGIVTFDPRVPQTVAGNNVQPAIVSATTDAEGDLQAIALVQGLLVQVVVSENGITYPPMAAMVPKMAAATFSQMLSAT